MSITLAAALTIGAHLGSHHAPDRPVHSNVNPGIYVRVDNWQAGYFRNSYRRDAFYAGYMQPIGPVDLMVGVSSGYTKKCSTQTNTYTTKVRTEDGYRAVTDTVTTETCMGFGRGALVPLAALSYVAPVEVMGVKPRIWVLPGFGKASTVFHLSLEKEFK